MACERASVEEVASLFITPVVGNKRKACIRKERYVVFGLMYN